MSCHIGMTYRNIHIIRLYKKSYIRIHFNLDGKFNENMSMMLLDMMLLIFVINILLELNFEIRFFFQVFVSVNIFL